MTRFIRNPDVKITLGSTEYTNSINMSIQVIRHECGFDTATITVPDYKSVLYPDVVTVGTTVDIEVKDTTESAFPTDEMFSGVVRFPAMFLNEGETLVLKCDGSGYGFSDTVCGQEYGAKSRYKTAVDTLSEILTDASHGIVTKWVNKQMESATASGFSYTTSIDANLTDTINYIMFPYKPNTKCLDDLCDLLTAIRVEGSNKGPHWIVTTDDVLRLKELYSDHASWHKYYNSATASDDCELYQGTDIISYELEKIGPEANYVLYYGAWRRPSNGDTWTENNAADWAVVAPAGCAITNDNGAGNFRVNDYSILITGNSAVNPMGAVYPSSVDWNYDFSSFREYNIPWLNFWAMRDATLTSCQVRLSDAAGANYFQYDFFTELAVADTWYHLSLPVGQYYKSSGDNVWVIGGGAPDWTDIDYVAFICGAVNGATLNIDGMHFGDAWVCRVAYNSTNIAANKLKIKVITDDVGKDDTLKSGTLGTTDTGLMARMAYAELLRSQTSSLVGWVQIPLINDVLPGQIFKIYAKKNISGTYKINGTEMRVTKIIHDIAGGCSSTLYLTDDVTNSHPRPLYEDRNKVLQSAARPEFQDRQSSSMKAGQIDIRVARLEEDYG
jgi:hypothetical protein